MSVGGGSHAHMFSGRVASMGGGGKAKVLLLVKPLELGAEGVRSSEALAMVTRGTANGYHILGVDQSPPLVDSTPGITGLWGEG